MSCQYSNYSNSNEDSVVAQFADPSSFEQSKNDEFEQNQKSRQFMRQTKDPKNAKATPEEENGHKAPKYGNICQTVNPAWGCLMNSAEFHTASRNYFTSFTKDSRNMSLIQSTVRRALSPIIDGLRQKEDEWKQMAKTTGAVVALAFVIIIAVIGWGMFQQRSFKQQMNQKISTFPNVFRQHVASKLQTAVEKTQEIAKAMPTKESTGIAPTSRRRMAKSFVKGLSKLNEDDISQKLSWL